MAETKTVSGVIGRAISKILGSAQTDTTSGSAGIADTGKAVTAPGPEGFATETVKGPVAITPATRGIVCRSDLFAKLYRSLKSPQPRYSGRAAVTLVCEMTGLTPEELDKFAEENDTP